MEENVALDSSKQKQFVKSVKGIKKLIKKNDAKGVSEKISASKARDGKVQKKKRVPRGLVYLGHIPHGFYEHAMTQYFKQFGVVTNARVIRSKRTGASKGFAFVEFKEPAVAEIVAETMNNYLMGKRLIKAAYIPPEKQRIHAKRMFWSTSFNPGSEGRLKMKKAYNAIKDDKGDLKKARKLISNLSKTKKKLNELGINYDFFSLVDVPESLVNLVSPADVKQEAAKKIAKATIKTKENPKKSTEKKSKHEKVKVKIESSIKGEAKKENKNQKSVKPEENLEIHNKTAKKTDTNKTQQAQKEKKLKDAGVKPVENFIKIQQESDEDSDSSFNFDSDEYEKMLSGEDSDLLSGEEDEDEEDEEDDSEEDSDDETPPKLVPASLPKVVQTVKAPKNEKKEQKKALNVPKTVQNEEKTPLRKRKATQNKKDSVVAPKTSKFENKNTQKLAKKQFKKKK